MLTVTLAARTRLASKLTKKNAASDHALRFLQRAGGFKLRLDRAVADDTTFTHDGKNVLLLDEPVSEAMKDLTLDAKKTSKGLRLTLS